MGIVVIHLVKRYKLGRQKNFVDKYYSNVLNFSHLLRVIQIILRTFIGLLIDNY